MLSKEKWPRVMAVCGHMAPSDETYILCHECGHAAWQQVQDGGINAWKIRAEEAESRLALAMAVVEAARPHSEWERGVSFSETEALRVSLAAFDAAQKEKP